MTESSAPVIVRRRLALAGPVEPDAVARVAADGIVDLRAEGGRALAVGYDLRRLGLVEVVAALRAAGIEPSRGLWSRLARFWAEFRDDNLRQQARIVHRCCSAGIPDRRKSIEPQI